MNTGQVKKKGKGNLNIQVRFGNKDKTVVVQRFCVLIFSWMNES